jgi:hypothetical protein
MQLHTIRAAGFTATVDAFAQDGEQLWFLSMLGSQQSVRAKSASIRGRLTVSMPKGPRLACGVSRRAARRPAPACPG